MSDTQRQVNLAVVEDHRMLLDSLIAAFERIDDIDLVAAAGGVEEFRGVVRDFGRELDVVLTDVDLAGQSGRAVVDLTNTETEAVVLVVTGKDLNEGLRLALETGAAGFISKTATLAELAAAVRNVAAGVAVFPAALLQQNSHNVDLERSLSARELEVLGHLASGQSVAEIAGSLHLSTHTVRNHVRSILRKLDAGSQLAAVVAAVRAGLVEIS